MLVVRSFILVFYIIFSSDSCLDFYEVEIIAKISKFGIINRFIYTPMKFDPSTEASIVSPYTSESITKKNKNRDVFLEKHSISLSTKGGLIGVVASEGDNVLHSLAEGVASVSDRLHLVQVAGKAPIHETVLHVETLESPELLAALDVCVFLGDANIDQVHLCQNFGVIPLLEKTPANKKLIVEYNPNQESGTGFFFKKQNPWEIFALLIRIIENKRFPYDWNTLRRKVMEGME